MDYKSVGLTQDQYDELTTTIVSQGLVSGVSTFCKKYDMIDKMDELFDLFTSETKYTDSLIHSFVSSKLFELTSFKFRKMTNSERIESAGAGPDGQIDDTTSFRVDGRKGDSIVLDIVSGHLELSLIDGGTIVFNGPQLRSPSKEGLPASVRDILNTVVNTDKPATMSKLRSLSKVYSISVSELS